MILGKLNARTSYRLGREDAMRGRAPLSLGYTGTYYAGYVDGANAWHGVMIREHRWANAVLVAENARLRRQLLECRDEAARNRLSLRSM